MKNNIKFILVTTCVILGGSILLDAILKSSSVSSIDIIYIVFIINVLIAFNYFISFWKNDINFDIRTMKSKIMIANIFFAITFLVIIVGNYFNKT